MSDVIFSSRVRPVFIFLFKDSRLTIVATQSPGDQVMKRRREKAYARTDPPGSSIGPGRSLLSTIGLVCADVESSETQ